MGRRIMPRLIRDVMSARPKTVGPETSVRALQRLFNSHNYNAFPVVDDAGVLLGIVTKLDLLRIFSHDSALLRPRLRDLLAEHVADIMRRGVITVGPRDLVATAVDRMLSSKLRSLPVVERHGRKNVLIGIVSRGDLIRSLLFEDHRR
jgi:CBS-domain-containing membrane protein